MAGESLELIRTATQEFKEFIQQVTRRGAKVVDSRRDSGSLESVSRRLHEVSRIIDSAAQVSRALLDASPEFRAYRDTLLTLHKALQNLQLSLLMEKARLENRRANLTAATAWATSLRDIS